MALTTGKKTTTVTPSSVASRMGVVPAYSGDWMATAAASLGKTLDTQAKKVAVLEEEKWKAQFSIDTYKAINNFAMKNRINPNGFTESTDAYINQLVQSVPNRYKGWAKQYAGMMAAREGQQIINRHYNTQQQDMIRLNADDTALWLDNTLRNMQSIPYATWDQTMFDSHLAEFTEKAVAYENMFNALDPQYRGQIDTPQVWKRKHQLAFEQARLNSKHTALLEAAEVLDREALTGQDVDGDGKTFESKGIEGELTNIQTTIAKINADLTKYMNNPKVDDLDGFATLGDTTTEERALLQQNSLKYVNNLADSLERTQNKLKLMNQEKYKNNMNNLFDTVSKPYNSYTDQELDNELNYFNANLEDRVRIKEANKKSNIIGKYSKVLYSPEGEQTEYYHKNEKVNFGKFNRTWTTVIDRIQLEFASSGIEIPDDEVKDMIINDHIYTMTGKDPQALTFEFDFLQGVASEDFDNLKNYALNMGVVPKPLTKYINNTLTDTSLNLDIQANRDSLVEIAGMFNALTEQPQAFVYGVEGISVENQQLLAQFHNDYKRQFDIIRRRGEADLKVFLDEKTFVKNWWELRNNWDQDESDKINQIFNQKVSEIPDNLFEEKITDTIDKAIQITPLTLFGVSQGNIISPLTKEEATKNLMDPYAPPPLFEIPFARYFKVNDYEKESLNNALAVEKLKEVLPDYLTAYYKRTLTSSDKLAIRTNEEIIEDIDKVLNYLISDLSNMGYE